MQYEKQIVAISSISTKLLGSTGIQTILELGARDGSETVALHKFFPTAKIYSFECNAATIGIWKERSKDIPQIKNIEMAVSDKDGTIDFFAIDQDKTETTWEDGNPGASSLLESSDKYEVEKYVQNKTTVNTTRLDTFFKKESIAHVDLVWMDIQGAELMALKGAGDMLQNIKIIHTEVEFFEIYKDQPLFTDIKKYLNENGFYLGYFTSFGTYSGDAVFIHHTVFNKKPLTKTTLMVKDVLLYPVYASVRFAKKIVKKIIKRK